MIEKPGTWGQVTEGTTLLSPTELPLLIVRTAPDRKGRIWYQAIDHNKAKYKISPKPSEAPVTLLECTEQEAINVAVHGLGAHRILEAERDRRTEERAKRWLVPPLPTKGRGALDHARTHLDWYHGTYSGSADYAGGFKTLKQITEAHTEMHEEHFMDRPHTHKGD